MIQRQHNVSEPIPPFYIRTLISLESSLSTAVSKEKDAKKKMNATNAKALTAMKQKLKKGIKEYEKEIKDFQTVRVQVFVLLPRNLLCNRIRKPLNVHTLSAPHLD